MNNFENRVLNFIRKNNMLKAGDAVLVGFSGGADSTALICVLDALKELLGIRLFAAHVNHGIRKEAGKDADFTRTFCQKKDIEYFLLEENVPEIAARERLTEEEAGRKVRYDFFDALVKEKGIDKIAIAHHQNDAAETFLFNVFRGSGIRGAAAIKPVRGNIIRPFLCVSRSEIEAYLSQKNIPFCTDATNADNIHTRNKIRNRLIPYIQNEINKSAVEHICRLSADFKEADEYLKGQAEAVFDRARADGDALLTLDINEIKKEADIIKKYVVLKCFEELTPARKDITSRHVDAVISLLDAESGNAQTDLPYNITATRSYDRISFDKKKDKSCGRASNECIVINNLKNGDKYSLNIPGLGIATIDIMSYNEEMTIPTGTYTKWFDCDRIQEAVFRHRKSDDYICIEQEGAVRKKKLSKFMTDEKIPASVRDSLYILADKDHCMWVPGYRMSCSYKISDKTTKILAITIESGGNEIG